MKPAQNLKQAKQHEDNSSNYLPRRYLSFSCWSGILNWRCVRRLRILRVGLLCNVAGRLTRLRLRGGRVKGLLRLIANGLLRASAVRAKGHIIRDCVTALLTIYARLAG